MEPAIDLQNIKLTEIAPNSYNPRKNFEGVKFDELVVSIAKVGVIEPILVRPVESGSVPCTECQHKKAVANKAKGKKLPDGVHGKCTRKGGFCEKLTAAAPFEIIAGERRWRATKVVAENNGGQENHTIPAIVKEVDEETAFELMTIENLQREDLTELEEARGFKSWIDRKGADRVEELAERCGISARYIRRRVAVMALPDEVLKRWNNGEIYYGHLEQLLRVKDDPELFEEVLDDLEYETVAETKGHIDSLGRQLKDAIFDIAACSGCTHNSQAQIELFDLGADEGAKCLNKDCYTQKVRDHLTAHWPIDKKLKSTGFRFQSEINHTETNFLSKVKKDCIGCETLVSIVFEDGTVAREHVCVGPKTCFKKNHETSSGKNANPEDENSTVGGNSGDSGPGTGHGGDDPATSVKWHGTFFREEFYQQVLPEKFNALDPDDPRVKRLVLFAFVKKHHGIHQWFAERHKIKKDEDDYSCYLSRDVLYRAVRAVPADALAAEIQAAAIAAALEAGFGTLSRHCMADLAGVDLETEFVITKAYIEKKTIPELLRLGEAELGGKPPIFKTEEARKFIDSVIGEKSGRFSKLKKSELVRVFTESGVDLTGRTPDEVLRADEYNPSGSLCG
ncbi:MAG: ParB/RepB/Spo0J family partition protein [Thermodesulfobacteriota bacterium]|nr:ParB/RepB/Spo0J family partition protein [Thermodesulfobacteriota bacterium]